MGWRGRGDVACGVARASGPLRADEGTAAIDVHDREGAFSQRHVARRGSRYDLRFRERARGVGMDQGEIASMALGKRS